MNTKAATKPNNKPREIKTVTMNNAFAGAADILGAGIDALFAQSEDPEFMVELDDIEIVDQVREQMEDDEQDLNGLGDSLVKYQIQAIFLRIMPAGHPKPYRLVAGERRYRAARLKGLPQLRAKARELTDEEAEDLQFAENVHRKNLTQIEEAGKIQRDLDKLGSVDAVLEKHQKSRAWLSKMLSLLNLPEQAKRLVTESVSADVEVINAVKTIEKADPMKAKELVDDLKRTRGKENARDKVAVVKEEVKPSKKQKEAKAEQAGTVATPKDRQQAQPSTGDIFTGAKKDETGSDDYLLDSSAELALANAHDKIFQADINAQIILDEMADFNKKAVDAWLYAFYEAGKREKDTGRAVMLGCRKGQFSSAGPGAFALVAFLHGAHSTAKFNLLDIFGSVKK